MRNPFTRIAEAVEGLVCLKKREAASRVRVGQKLDQVITMLEQSKKREIIMSADLSALEAEVARNTEIDQSAIALLQGLATQIESLKNDPIKIQEFVDSMRSSSDSLAAAVAANTPSE